MSRPYQLASVVAGFPGIGKSYLTTSPPAGHTILDLDTSAFSHLSNGTANPAFPRNYIDAITPHLSTPNLVLLVGVHDVVRDALVSRGVRFTLVYPEEELKEEYMARWKRRGSPEGFLKKMDRAWNEFVGSCRAQRGCDHLVLRRGEFLGGVVNAML